MPRIRAFPIHRFFGSLLALALCLGLLTAGAQASNAQSLRTADPQAAGAVQLNQGSLSWGVKASWRQYAGPAKLAGGAGQPEPGGAFSFPLTSGNYAAASGSTTANFSGSLQWKSHYYPDEKDIITPPPGYTGPLDIYVLDVTFANPSVTISAEGASLSMEVRSRDINTWQMVDFGRVPLVQLDISENRPVISDGTTAWSGLSAAWTQQGVDAIGYAVGQIVDPVDVKYTGPGGAPVVTESWALPGTQKIVMGQNGLIDGVRMSTLWADQANGIYHVALDDPATGEQTVRAYDLRNRAFIGAPLLVPTAVVSSLTALKMADPGQNRGYFKSNSAAGSPIDSALQWDPTKLSYRIVSDFAPIPVGAGQFLWNPVRGEAFVLSSALPPGSADQNARKWTLTKWTVAAGAEPVSTAYSLPAAPPGADRSGGWYRLAGGAALDDGSLVLVRGRLTAMPGSTVPAVIPAQHLTFGSHGVTVAEIAGTGDRTQAGLGFNGALAFSGGVYLTRMASRLGPALVQQISQSGNGQFYLPNPSVELGNASTFGIDPVTGTVWGQDLTGQTLSAARNGALLASLTSPFLTQNFFAPVVGPDQIAYAVTYDGRPQGTTPDGKGTFGFAGFSLASSPGISAQPVAVSAVVPAGSSSSTAVFRAAATAAPAAEVQWQSKTKGVLAFKDIPGATAGELKITVGQYDDGAQYRAVFRNPAGAIASKPALLTVTMAKAPDPQPPITPGQNNNQGGSSGGAVAGFLTWGVKDSFRSYLTGAIARGSITVSGGASGVDRYTFPQSGASSWNPLTGTGRAGYRGTVQFYGHSGVLNLSFSDPQISVDSAGSGTLSVSVNGSAPVGMGSIDLAAAGKTELDGGVAYRNAPVTLTAAGARMFSYGSSQFYQPGQAMDPVSFTIGAPLAPGTTIGPDGANTGSAKTTVAAYSNRAWQPPADPPAKEGISLLGADPLKLQAGSSITATASGFQPNEKDIKAVLYSEPRVLADDLVADGQGVVTWRGALPSDLTGEHTLTFQGSVNRGLVLNLGAPDAAGQCTVAEATLSWGFKESFRAYIQSTIANGNWSTANGASYQTPNFGWSQGAGSINPVTKAGLVKFTGSISFTGHDGVLNTTVANPQIQLVDDRTAFLLLDVSGPTMDGAMIDDKAASFLKLDLAAAGPVLKDGVLTVTAAPGALTPAGSTAFPNYPSGAAFDPVSFSFPVGADCGTPPKAEPPVAAPPANALSGSEAGQSADFWWLLWAIPAAILGAALLLAFVWLLRRRLIGNAR
ncbi:MAG: HtaA domain-containing protein [Renibacterium sp.]|nr:HtaA domain-containing protein [Renibacterium sp.]